MFIHKTNKCTLAKMSDFILLFTDMFLSLLSSPSGCLTARTHPTYDSPILLSVTEIITYKRAISFGLLTPSHHETYHTYEK